MNPVNFETMMKQFAATCGGGQFSVRISLINGDTVAGQITPQAAGTQGLPRMISIRSPSGTLDAVEFADITRISGPFILHPPEGQEIPRPRFEALQSTRDYWYVDKRTEDGGETIVGGADAPLAEGVAKAIATALNEAVDDYAALLALSGLTPVSA